jgi:hypothetical protein
MMDEALILRYLWAGPDTLARMSSMWQGHFQVFREGGLAMGGSRQSRCQCNPQRPHGMMARVEPLDCWQAWQMTGLPSASRRRRRSGTSSSLFFLRAPLVAGTTSSYSPSMPVRTPSNLSRTAMGRRKALEFLASSLSTSGRKLKRGGAGAAAGSGARSSRSVRHTLQNHSTGIESRLSGGSTQLKWNERVHPSQQINSPLPEHDEQ